MRPLHKRLYYLGIPPISKTYYRNNILGKRFTSTSWYEFLIKELIIIQLRAWYEFCNEIHSIEKRQEENSRSKTNHTETCFNTLLN